MGELTLEQRRHRLGSILKIGTAAVACLIISPIIFGVIKGMVGLAVSAAVGLTIVNLAPVLSMKLANWKIKAIVGEAKENPIETLTNVLIEKKKAFDEFRDRVTDSKAAAKDFRLKVDAFKQKFPARAAEFEQRAVSMESAVSQQERALKDAMFQIQAGESKLEEMKAYWEMSLAAQAASRATGMDTGDLYEKLKADTAVDAVFSSMNRVFAELETAAALSDQSGINVAQIEYHPAQSVMETGLASRTPSEPVWKDR